jgi:hypothetical protein
LKVTDPNRAASNSDRNDSDTTNILPVQQTTTLPADDAEASSRTLDLGCGRFHTQPIGLPPDAIEPPAGGRPRQDQTNYFAVDRASLFA